MLKLTDLWPMSRWIDLERNLHETTGLNGCVYDAAGFRFTGYVNWANPICPLIKAVPSALQSVCSLAHQNMVAQAKKTECTVIGECDAGFLKICVPVFVDGAFIGALGGCGLLPEDSEVETFLVGRLVGRDEDELEALAKDIPRMSRNRAEEVASTLEQKAKDIVSGR